LKLAIVHDYLNQFGGAERVVLALSELYPDAPIYTSFYAADRLPERFRRLDIRVSWMQKLPFFRRFFKWYFLLYPLAFESFDLAQYDVILSSSSAYAKGVKKRAGQLHICYCHTPMRFVWRYADYVRREGLPGIVKQLLPFCLEPVKEWDCRNSRRVDTFIANSQTVAGRIKEIYGRDSVIIFPPVETELFRPSAVDRDYYLVVARLNYYKRVDLAVQAFNRLDLPLKIIGDGPARSALQKMAGPNIEFLGRLDDEETARYLAECRALIFPGEEDFGIVPVEAMACGRPVIAYQAGGALETVVEGETGLFFFPQTAEALASAVKKFRFTAFNKTAVRQRAGLFAKEKFKERIAELVRKKYEEKFGKR
jgi:glycosyltransferase involved in cell wall biosynthesis